MNLPDISKLAGDPALRRTKIKVSPDMLPMLATILPARIVGSGASTDGNVVLLIEGVGLPNAEFCTLMIDRPNDKKVVVEIKAMHS